MAVPPTFQMDQVGMTVDCGGNCQHSNWTTSRPPVGDLNRRKSPI